MAFFVALWHEGGNLWFIVVNESCLDSLISSTSNHAQDISGGEAFQWIGGTKSVVLRSLTKMSKKKILEGAVQGNQVLK